MNSKLGAGALVNCLGIVWMPACLYPLPIKGHSPVTPIQLPNYSSSPYLTKCLFVVKLMLLQNAIPNVNIQMWILFFFLNPPQELLSWPCRKSYILLKRNFLDWFFLFVFCSLTYFPRLILLAALIYGTRASSFTSSQGPHLLPHLVKLSQLRCLPGAALLRNCTFVFRKGNWKF